MLQSVKLSGEPLTIQDDRTFFAKRFFDHPAISADDYSDALYNSY